MSVPSMVHRSGDSLIVRSVVSGDAPFDSAKGGGKANVAGSSPYVVVGEEENENNSKELLPECKIKRNYSCGDCDHFTQNPRDHLHHVRNVHGQNVRIYECPSCLYASRHLQKLLRHTRMVHGASDAVEMPAESGRAAKSRKRPLPHEDDDSVSSTADEDVPYDAEEEATPEKSTVFKCSVCAFTARNQVQLTKHEREEHIKTKFFRCTKCTYVTHMKARFTKHVKYHSMPMIKCDMCDFRTPYKWNLDRHCKNHNGRGAFRCSACNFTADIKQSLTVHEMNHHVPPVGQAAGLGIGRRRNKVGASDATAAEEAAAQAQVTRQELEALPVERPAPAASTSSSNDESEKIKVIPPKPRAPVKKSKATNTTTDIASITCAGNFGSDFIHPDDIIHHANGNVYIKNKCKLCNYKSAWDSEMAKHEKKVHGIDRDEPPPPKIVKKTIRPVPNLIPIPAVQSSALKFIPRLNGPPVLKAAEPPAPLEPTMSQEAINEICARSANSALKDFASLFNSESLFNNFKEHSEMNTQISKVPDLIPASVYTSGPKIKPIMEENFKIKHASFFDTLKEKLLTSAGDSANSICKYCGHKSKCLTEQVAHQKVCGKQTNSTLSVTPVHNIISSSRCQYCRQRCKSSVDLFNHLKTCPEALKTIKKEEEPVEISDKEDDGDDCELRIDEDAPVVEAEVKPHPMENKVFVWNNIEVPMDIEVDDSIYEYTDDRIDDNGSLDLSIRTQSPGGSENSYVGIVQDYAMTQNSPVPPPTGVEKIPTHGNDITVAQHKRVFKCPHCTFWASTASRFHVHIVGHLNKKPFECSLCAYRSNWRWDITKHIKLKSVRDPAHESAKVLMTDETGRRNYSKYNAYLTEIPVSGEQSMETSGGSGTRHRHQHQHEHHRNSSPGQSELNKLISKNGNASGEFQNPVARPPLLRPPPPLKAADGIFFAKKRAASETKRTHFKCKKCNFKDPSRETLLEHVKGHYTQTLQVAASISLHQQQPQQEIRVASPERDEASVNNGNSATAKGQAPFRCGHCNQVSNWKHVIQRHCRLKHSGDIRVVSNKNGQEKLEIEEHIDEPDHIDVPQTGTFKCNACPFSNNNHMEFDEHLKCHTPKLDSVMKCYYCKFFVSKQEDLLGHLKLHGITDTEDFLARMVERSGTDGDGKKFRCLTCPYVTNSKSQFTYHRQFHRPRGNQYNCSKCSYNVSKRHLLHQHLKVHGINITPQKQNGEVINVDEISDEIEEVPSGNPSFEAQNFADIPLVWVSKNGKFTKMFKCRSCPHVNLRKVNIQEHEKMHSTREKNLTTNKIGEVEHRCTECNYICNNAGVLSSHSKVHQGLYGTIHSLVDLTKTDEEQIRELSNSANISAQIYDSVIQEEYENAETASVEVNHSFQNEEPNDILYFCHDCPARFLRESEYRAHLNFHSKRLFYKCNYCTYTARQKPHLLAHNKVHTSEYQEETKALKEHYVCSFQPRAYPISNGTGELVWKVFDTNKISNLNMEIENLNSITKTKTSQCIPLSGTELFQQKSEAQLKHNAEKAAQQNKEKDSSPPPQKPADPQFGTLMHGNPKFIYPTYLKNGKMKEKRYKCPKCPSAFEKREQYKVHLGLHGSKQRYQCENCDYSVKYYANYVQHSKKHKMNEDALAAKKSEDDENEEADDNEENVVTNNSHGINEQVPNSDSQQNKVTNSSKEIPVPVEDRKIYWCPNCPYTNYRKDAVDNHQKRHVSLSGIESNYTCQHCDYSVPQQHFLRDHTKLHFTAKANVVEEFMECDNIKLTYKKFDPQTKEETDADGDLIFEEQGANDDKSYLPPLSADVSERFNNNEGEKRLVNLETGELVSNSDKQSSDPKGECRKE